MTELEKHFQPPNWFKLLGKLVHEKDNTPQPAIEKQRSVVNKTKRKIAEKIWNS